MMIMEMKNIVNDVYGVSFNIDVDSSIETKDQDILRHLYYIIDEAVINAVKHSRAQSIDVSLVQENGFIVLKVRDDGKGMPEELVQSITLAIQAPDYKIVLTIHPVKRDDGELTYITPEEAAQAAALVEQTTGNKKHPFLIRSLSPSP